MTPEEIAQTPLTIFLPASDSTLDPACISTRSSPTQPAAVHSHERSEAGLVTERYTDVVGYVCSNLFGAEFT